MLQRVRRGLQHYWPLDEASGNAIDALYGPDGPIHLTDTNTVTAAAGPSANLPAARQFTNASAEKFTVATARSLNMGRRARGFTAAIWAYPDSVLATHGLFGKDSGGTDRNWRVIQTLTPQWQLLFYDGTTLVGGATGGTPAAGTWSHVVVVCDHVQAYLYINGAFVLKDAHDTANDFSNGVGAFDLGNDNVTTLREWDGRLAHAAIWHRALTPVEIRWLYNNGQGRDLRRGV